MRLKVISDGTLTHITDAETGRSVEGVIAARWTHAAPGEVAVLTVDVVNALFEAVVESERVTVNKVEAVKPTPVFDEGPALKWHVPAAE